MNFLAHQFLAGDDELLRVGNFIADFVKGNKYLEFEKGIRLGILHHREIDWYTDNHPIIKSINSSLRSDFGKYAGVATDVYFDHFLARDWNQITGGDLKTYTTRTYDIMLNNNEAIPPRAMHMLKYMKRDDWLFHYSLIEGVARSLRGIASRTQYNSGLERGGVVLKEHYTNLENAFNEYLSEIKPASEKLLEKAKAVDADNP